MISHEHRCIFVHVPKTGGTSIAKKLGLFGEVNRDVQDHRRIRDADPRTMRNLRRSIVRRGRSGRPPLTGAQFKTYYKFAFVRNSWDRVFSWYRGVLRDPVHQLREGVPPDCTFRDYVADHLEGCWALHSQLYWIADSRGRVGVDFIGRFEALVRDFARVGARLGLRDVSLPHLNRAENGLCYVDAYDSESRERVARRFHEEIERFGFEFGE